MRSHEVVVVGGGIVGLATARELALAHGIAPLVVERESRLATHQTGHNSGVLHSGLYYPPDSHKARACVEGRRALYDYLAGQGLAHERCGKLVVALDERELPRLEELERRGTANGLRGLRRLEAGEIAEREPHATGVGALLVPETGIVDFGAVAASFAREIVSAGGEIVTGAGVRSVTERAREIELSAGGRTIRTGLLVACAGLESDRFARTCGLDPAVRIVPFRGQYFELVPAARHTVRHLIYPVPDPELPFLGVHLTRRIDGTVEVGPNAVLAWRRDGYEAGSWSVRDAADTLLFPGFWRMSRRQAAVARREYRRSWSRSEFVTAARRLLPAIEAGHLRPGRCGIRAQAVDRQGRLVDDFAFAESERMLHVLNAPSPAATAAMAIARELAARAVGRLADVA